MTKAKSLALADVGDCATFHVRCPKFFQKIGFALFTKSFFKLGRGVEIVFQRAFTFGGYEDEFLDASGSGLVNRVLD